MDIMSSSSRICGGDFNEDQHGWADFVDGFMWVVKQSDKMCIEHVRAIIGPGHLVQENAASVRIDSI